MTLSPVCPSKLPPELAQPVTKGSTSSTGITKTIRDIVYNPSAFVERGIAPQHCIRGRYTRESPFSRRATKRRRSFITELSFHGIHTSRPEAKGVTHVS